MPEKMSTVEVERVLRASIGQRLRITFDDDVTQSVDVSSVDDEGFVHSGPNGSEPDAYWTRFEGVKFIATESKT